MIFQLMIFLINSYRFFYKYVGFFFFFFENLHGWIPIFFLNMQNCSWTLDECVCLLFIAISDRYFVRLNSTITHSTRIRSDSHSLFSVVLFQQVIIALKQLFFFLHKKFNAEIFSLDWSQIQSEFKGNLLVYNRCQGNVKRKSFSYT